MAISKQPCDAALGSVELSRAQSHLVGIAHYRKILEQRQDLQKLCDNSVLEPGGNCTPTGELIDIDDATQSTRSSVPDPGIDYTKRPAAPTTQSEYESDIYSATTYSAAVCLAIIRIAEKNLSSIDFSSAVTQLPNLAPTDALPALPRGTFTGNLPYTRRESSIPVKIAFLPEYYADYRHALGYYCHRPDLANPGRTQLTTIVFTPCTTADLENWDMLRYEAGKEGDGVYGFDVVGVEGGRWLDVDSVEDCTEWDFAYRVTMRWEKRVSQTLVRFKEREDGGSESA